MMMDEAIARLKEGGGVAPGNPTAEAADLEDARPPTSSSRPRVSRNRAEALCLKAERAQLPVAK